MNLTSIKALARTKLFFITQHKTEVMLGVGIVSGITGTVLACRATLKASDILDKTRADLDTVIEANEIAPEDYTVEDQKKDRIKIYTRTTIDLAKEYAIPVVLGGVSIACVIGGHRILRKENAALGAALTGLTKAFKKYRTNVINEFGEDKDMEFRGIRREKIETVDENGKKHKTEELVVDPTCVSQYARFFDETNRNWSKSGDQNFMFLRSQQNFANDKLRLNGHIFLNEVYDLLGLPRSEAGCVVGWVEGYGDDFVDFGFMQGRDQASRDFVNGFTQSVMLDFNVDGVIADMFNQKRFKLKMAEEY